MENVNVIQDGREKSARYDMTNVKCQTATVTVTASVENVNAYVAIKENSVKKVNSHFLQKKKFLFVCQQFYSTFSARFTYHEFLFWLM